LTCDTVCHVTYDRSVVFYDQIKSDICLLSRYNKNIFLRKIKQVYTSILKLILPIIEGVGVIAVYATFNNVTVISWWSVLLMEEAIENHRPVVSHVTNCITSQVHLSNSQRCNSIE
jgi:hypothetical protein